MDFSITYDPLIIATGLEDELAALGADISRGYPDLNDLTIAL